MRLTCRNLLKPLMPRRNSKVAVVVTTIITCYSDRSFTFIVKSPPAAVLLKSAAKIVKGSGEPNRTKVANVTKDQIREIAQTKLPDLNTTDIEAAIRMVEGTAKSMGLNVT